jgi:chromosome transmission fidelity protein 18
MCSSIQPPTDFFGRPIIKPVSSRGKKGKASIHVERKEKVSFKFNEGNSAAVRKAVKVSTFL